MRSNSLFRALRVDKLTYAALEATLLAYVKRDHEAVPTLRMMQLSKRRSVSARILFQKFVRGIEADLIDGESLIGGGSAPSSVLPTRLIAITARKLSANELATRLRRSDPPIIARVEDRRVLLDLRTVFPGARRGLAANTRTCCHKVV